jgi:hypothetical protein
MLRADGFFGHVVDHAAPRYRPDGTFAGFIGTIHELAVSTEWADRPGVIPPGHAGPVSASRRNSANVA